MTKKSTEETKKFLKKYGWNSIFFRYWSRLFVATMIPFFLVCTVAYVVYNSYSQEKMEQFMLTNYTNIDNQMQEIVNKLSQSYNLITEYSDTNTFLAYPDMNTGSMTVASFTANINTFLSLNQISFVDNIYLYSYENDYVISTIGGSPRNNFKNIPLFENFSPEERYYLSFFPQAYNPLTQKDVLTVVFTIYSNYVPTGILAFEITPKTLEETFAISSNAITGACIIDENAEPIYTLGTISDSTLSEATELENNVIHTRKSNYVYKSQIYDEKQFILFTEKTFGYNPLQITLFVTAIILLVFIVPLFISYYLSKEFYRAIENIVNVLHDSDFSASEMKFDEIRYIAGNIHTIQNKNTELEEILTKNISEIKQLQSIALQTQINPHFLFNTLNTVTVLTIEITRGNNPAAQIIRLLSELLSQSLNTTEYIVPLAEEISYLKKYVQIEQIKTKNSFDVEWDIEPELMNTNIVKLSLQPIVENAFYHGIKNIRKVRRGLISISAHKRSKNLEIIISDNGLGMTPEKLAEIRNKLLYNDIPNSKHIGLCNTDRRIKLFFGEEYGLSINSDKNGTTVTVTIPL